MKSKSKSVKNKRGGGGCSTGYRWDFSNQVTNGTPSLIKVENCQSGGKRSKKRASVKRTKRGKKLDEKKVEIIINKLCKSLKRKCTPKYKQLLKKIVVNNM